MQIQILKFLIFKSQLYDYTFMFILCLIEDWKYRHAALMAISACGEGCHKQMEERLDGIVEAILPKLFDPVSADNSLIYIGILER